MGRGGGHGGGGMGMGRDGHGKPKPGKQGFYASYYSNPQAPPNVLPSFAELDEDNILSRL